MKYMTVTDLNNAGATLLVALYYGVMFGLIQVVLFISDVIMALHSLVW